MKTIRIFTLLLAVMATVSSCKEVEGPRGPAGPQGPQGNANVHSKIYIVSNWTYVSSACSYKAELVNDDITQSIVSSGAVVVYMSNNSGGWELLPILVFHDNYFSHYNAVHYLNGLTIWLTDSDLYHPATPGTITFKVVTIASQAMAAHPDIDFSDYTQVQQAFDLTD